MKKILGSLLLIVLAFAMISCGGQTEDQTATAEPVQVMGIVMPSATHGFTGESIQHAEAEAKALAAEYGFEYKFLTASEASEQNNHIDTLINENVDVIVLWPMNGDELRSAAQKVMDAGIPLVIYDRLITDFTPTVEFMGDNTKIGEMAGEYYNTYFADEIAAGDTIPVLEFKGDLSTVPQQRTDGFLSTANEQIVFVQSFTTNWQRQTALEQMETYLTTADTEEIESLKAVFTHDDEVVLGVLDAIRNYNGDADLSNLTLVSGVGARRENLDTFAPVKEELGIDQVTYAFSPALIRQAVELGADILQGGSPSGLILGETVEVDNSNAEEFRSNPIYITRYSLEETATEAPAMESAEGKVMGIVMPSATHGFTGESIQHAEAEAKALAAEYGFEYVFLTAAEASEQNNHIDTLLNDEVDVIVLWPMNGDELRSAAQKVVDAGIPLVIYDRLITDFTPTVEFMGDNTKIGEMAGEYYNAYFADEIAAGDTIPVLEFKGDLSTVPQQRTDGFLSTANEQIEFVQSFTTNWQRQTALEQMETYLTTADTEEIESLKAVFTHDDEVVLGVLDAIRNYNGDADLSNLTLVSGVGARRENLDTFAPVKEELGIDQVTYAFSPALIRQAVELGADILQGGSPSGLILGETVEVDNSNAEEFRSNPIYITRYSLEETATEAPAMESAEGKVMGIVMPSATHGFTGESIQHAEAEAKALAAEYGFEYVFLTAAEASEQNNHIDTLLNDEVDVIVLWPMNGDELRSAAQKVVDAGIPLVIYDRLITDFTPTVEFMGDNTKIGEMAGEYYNSYFADEIAAGDTIPVLEFKGDLSTVPQQRTDGFLSTANEQIEFVQSFTTNWQRQTALEQMETYLTTADTEEIESLKAVFTHDDEVVLGVLDAIRNYNGDADLSNLTLVSGVGARRENLDTFAPVKEELGIDQVTYAFSPALIRQAVELGADILQGGSPSGLILGETVEVDNSNAEEFRSNPIYITRYSLEN